MKKNSSFLLLYIVSICSYAQIPNNSFENWTTNSSSNPDVWMSSNSFWFGSNSVIQDTNSYSGFYAARVQTVNFGSDTARGMLLIGTPGNQTINGGVPYTGHPDSMSCAVHFNIQPDDTAVVYIFFKKNGLMIGMFAVRFWGTQPAWLPVKEPVYWFVPDSVYSDTVAALITSSNMDYPGIPGSYLAVDEIAFNNDTTPFPNGDFESWITTSWDDLADGWNSLNPLSIPFGQLSATKDTSPYSGSYAVRVQSLVFPNFGNQVMGFVFLGQWTTDGPGGGIPFTQKPEKLTGYYKYFPASGDTGSAIVQFDNDTNLQFSINLTAASSYTYFEVPINLLNDPDTVLIGISASRMNGTSTPGSIIIADDLNFVIIVGDEEVKIPIKNGFNLSFDHANRTVSLKYLLTSGKEASLAVYELSGKQILNISFGMQNAGYHEEQIDMSGMAQGLYLFNFKSGKESSVRKIAIQ
ncbi:MAG: T9SS type A sorting domain-containing protein [Bacteroidetes bacterium]|nr:T9SS type A sorting domain-containing protein [Bacteroidota bacterium]